MAHII